MSKPKAKPVQFTGKVFFVVALLAIAFPAAVALWVGTSRVRSKSAKMETHTPVTRPSDAEVYATYGKSPTCKSCHEEAYANWEKSHHALAERAVDPNLDKQAFDPARTLHHGTQNSEARLINGVFQLVTAGLDGQVKPFVPERVIGVDPLLQYLIPAPGGRWQTAEMTYDPRKHEWFNVFGEEDRQPGEWGHWTGRGMNWNNMCAVCHNTRVRKNFDERTDSYRTAMAEMGVGCEACHGPMADHNAWQAKNPNKSGDPTVRKITRQEMFSACGQCHARRAELTGDFKPGDNFFDHHQLTIPDETDIFYPDGQIRDEDYEFTAFLGSKMHASGVRCVDCHEPHTSKIRVPGNLMCLACHAPAAPVAAGILPAVEPGFQPGGTGAGSSGDSNISSAVPGGRMPPSTSGKMPDATGAPRIDLETHSHHKPKNSGTPAEHKAAALIGSGDDCVHCHMPITTYMQRHPRHDHGFTIPDPRMTKELGIPNACNRCHTNQTSDWSLEAMNKWYGPRTNELMRTRATAVAKARAGDAAAMPMLVKMVESDTNAFWRAVAANLLKRWAGEPSVTSALFKVAGETNELLRAMAVRGLEPLAQSSDSSARAALTSRLADPVRAVRIEAAWALHHSLDTNSVAGRDLLAQLHFNADQPAGAMQLGVFHLDRGNLPVAMDYFRRAVSWDTNSAPLHHALAVALSVEGKATEAVESLKTACRLAPRDAEYRYKLALALNDLKRLDDSRVALEETVKLDPQFARAWYNLGLAYSQQEKTDQALDALVRAESLDGRSPLIPYARATILARLNRTDEARAAARRALEIQPSFREAAELLQALGR